MQLVKIWLVLFVVTGLAVIAQALGAFPHLSVDEGTYEMNIAGVIDTVDVRNHMRGLVITDHGLVMNFKSRDILKYTHDNMRYSMYIVNSNEFMMETVEYNIYFKKI